jgi:NADPH:quinone reductase-like Zn-dependent oxidoreductase
MEVRIAVRASALNHIDLWLTRGLPKPPAYPHVSGSDCAGVVDAVGPGVTDWSVGDEVVMEAAVTSLRAIQDRGIDSVLEPGLKLLGEHRWGGHGEYVVVPAWHPVAKPANRSWAECAAYPVAYVTAWRMIRKARLEAGDSALVVGIGGGVAMACLALGKALGINIFVTSRDAEKRRRAIEMGAADAFDSSGDFPVKVDAVLDSVGAATWSAALKSMKIGARYVTCGGTSGTDVPLQLPRLFFKHLEIIGVTLGSHQEFVKVTDMVAKGLEIHIDEVVPWKDYPAALERLSTGAQLGKIVLDHD